MNNLNSGLIFKWLKSENTSSKESRHIAKLTRERLGCTAKQYRKMLSYGREKTKVLERIMSLKQWDRIDFSKIPSRAGLIYRNAFARHDLIKEKYEKFAKDTTTKVNAGTLNPCDVVNKARSIYNGAPMDDVERLMVNKYWENLTDYFNGAVFDGVAVVDTSGSMTGWTYEDGIHPIDVAVSLGMYCAEKCNPESPWYGHYITFSRNARLVPVEGVDFVDKVRRIVRANLCENTNIRSVFDLLLSLAIENHMKSEDLMENVIIISDMEFDHCASFNDDWVSDRNSYQSEMEAIKKQWENAGYKMPHLIFWCVQSRQDNIPMRDDGNVTFVSGYSASLFEQIMSGKRGIDFVLDKLNSERYSLIK